MRLSHAAPLSIATLALSLASCGDDDKLAKADLVKEANAICTDFTTKIKAVPQPSATSDPTQAAAYYKETRPIVTDLVNQLSKLEPEDDLKKDWEAFVTNQGKAARLLDDLVLQISKRDTAAQATLTQINTAVADADAAVDRVGASACVAATA